MHRLPKIISQSLNRRKNRTRAANSSPQESNPKRLDRSYAFRYNNFELPSPPPASSSPHAKRDSPRGPLLDSCSGNASLRVDGTDGEFELICETYGFSGIDDFSISPEEYEAMKVRSSTHSVVFNQSLEPLVYSKTEVGHDVECYRDCSGKMEEDDSDVCVGFSDNRCDLAGENFGERWNDFHCMDSGRADAFVSNISELSKNLGYCVKVSDEIYNDNVTSRTSKPRGNGIKRIHQSVLVPPPLMCSTWDPSREFVLDSDEDTEGGLNMSEQEKDIRTREGNYAMLGSCSFTTFTYDDDFSSTITTPMSSASPKFRRVIEDWQKGELLGCGSFGSVYEGISDDGFFFAVKEVSLLDQGDMGKQRIIQLEQEIALLSQFEHENIVQYYGTKKDKSHLYIFLELVTKGSLLSIYQTYDLRVSQVSAYTRQILHGLKYLHNRNVVHRDIKCANILVDTNGSVKLADFGLAKAIKLNDVKSCRGTAFWMAPEVVRSQGYGLAADIWSLGCTVLEMLTRRFPYSDLEWMSALFRIGKGERPLIPDSLPGDARDFILKCLQVDAIMRPTAARLLDHPFVKRSLTPTSGTVSPHSFGRQINKQRFF